MSHKFNIYDSYFICKSWKNQLQCFKRKYSNSSEVNVGLPTANVDIPILENVDVSILENIHSSIPKNIDVLISQTQFQRVDLDSLDYDLGTRKQIWEYRINQRDEIWVFVLVDSLLILYGYVFKFFFFLFIFDPP